MERKCALQILNEISENGSYSNLAINRGLEKYPGAGGGFVRQLVYGVLENQVYLDYLLSGLIKTPLAKVHSFSLNILRMGVYQLKFMDSVPDYAAINESVNLAKQYTKGQASFVNGVLRNVMRKGDTIPLPDPETNHAQWLSVKYSYHQWLIDYWLAFYGKTFTQQLVIAGNEVPPLTIRVNALKTDRKRLMAELSREGFEVSQGRHSLAAIHVKGRNVLESVAFQQGLFQVQDESSMMAVELLDPLPGDFLLDLCAAPGGKTVYAGEKMKNQGRIMAFDLYEQKLDVLLQFARDHGVENIQTKVQDATIFCKEFAQQADKVLCDVPCSGLGVIRRKPEIKYTKSHEDILQLAVVQKNILKTAADYVRPGGTLVYSTCTISPLENEQVVSDFLQNRSDFTCLTQKQLTPFDGGTDGFFLCKFKKNE